MSTDTADSDIVDRLYGDFTSLLDFLSTTDGAKFVPVVEELLPKAMLLAAASYFEKRLSHEVERFAADAAGEEHVLRCLIKRRVINRQYHTWFNWGSSPNGVNSFLSMFGSNFKAEALRWIKEDDDLQKSVIDFLDIGSERNRLVHENFGEAPLEKTVADVNGLYESAKIFVDWFPAAIRRYSSEQTALEGA